MNELEAIVLGIVQGFTEFLPVSSSGHLVIARNIFGVETTSDLTFEIAVHAATVLSTIVAFRKEIWQLLCGFFKFKNNAEMQYVLKIFVSMIPVLIVGLFFKDFVEELFGSGLFLVGCMLILTSALLIVGETLSKRQLTRSADHQGREVGFKEAVIIGLAQAVAVLPGLSRSGTTIATGLMCGVKKSAVAQFSFLMVIIPILGEAFLELVGGEFSVAASGISLLSLSLGFLTAFISGYVACRWMINIVKKARLYYFAIYCSVAGIITIIASM